MKGASVEQGGEELQEDERDFEELERKLEAARAAGFAAREVKEGNESEPD
jgi:hypothetical protein